MARDKSARVVAAAEAAQPPWSHEKETGPAGGVLMTLVRGDETLVIEWDGNWAFVPNCSYMLSGVRDYKPKNVAEALRIIEGQPQYKAKRSAPRQPVQPRERKAPAAVPLPFDPENDDDKTIIRAVRGKVITWRNTMMDEFETGRVPDKKKVIIKVDGQEKAVWRTSRNITMKTTSTGRRVLTFPAVGEQYRSMGLDQIVSVR